MSPATLISELEARTDWSERPSKRGQQRARIGRIENYLLINGDYISAAQAAARLGVSDRTVTRYRAILRALRGTS